MLLGCCHCGPQESRQSETVPSGDVPLSLFPSESATSIIGGQPGFCGVCYNLPGRWKVGINQDWFVYNAAAASFFNDCPIVPEYFYRTLYSKPATGTYNGLTPDAWLNLHPVYGEPCAVWATTDKAIELTTQKCDGTGGIFPTCGPNNFGIPQIEMAAFSSRPWATYFAMFYWWSRCGLQYGFKWDWWVVRQTQPITSISCVREWGANFANAMPITVGQNGRPYSLSNVNTSWDVVMVEPV